jgi:DNA adenine methylase
MSSKRVTMSYQRRSETNIADLRNEIINVASVPHRSLFRYPGGKTWLVPRIRRWLTSLSSRPKQFCEPFAGGGIVGLSVLFEGFVDTLAFVELDDDVAAVWQAILNGKGEAVAERILSFEVNYKNVRSVLDTKPRTIFDQAFATIIRNRMQRGGILAPGASLMKDGENGRGLLSRWYPQTLKRRILDIVAIKQQINFIQGDGIAFLQEHTKNRDTVFLIDPPYTVAGRRLYNHSEIDHDKLFKIAAKLKGDFLMTYDNVEPVRELARKHGLDIQEIAMKNTHHAVMSELLIGRDLDWARV